MIFSIVPIPIFEAKLLNGGIVLQYTVSIKCLCVRAGKNKTTYRKKIINMRKKDKRQKHEIK